MKKIMRKISEFKLVTKFSISFILLVAIPMVIFNFASFKYTRQGMLYQVKTDVNNKITDEARQISKMIELCSMTSQIFLGDEQLQDFLTSIKLDEDISAQEYLDFSKNHVLLYEGMINSNPDLYEICVYADSNTFPEMLPVLFHKEKMDPAVWNREDVNGKWYLSDSESVSGKPEKLSSIVMDINNIFGEKVGKLEVSVRQEDLFPGISESDEENIKFFLSDDDNLISANDSLDEFFHTYCQDIVDEINEESEAVSKLMVINHQRFFVTSHRINELSGNYISLVNVEKRFDEITSQQIKILLSILLLFIGMIILVRFTVKLLLKRFYATIKVVEKIQEGNLDQRIEDPGNDEIGQLGSQINKMLDRIQALMQENINREVLIKNTEIKALQNQINSHFIYNVLESIKMMAEIEEEYSISDAVTALGELLRYNMRWVKHNVTVREEIAYIRNYIQLMNLRYDFEIILNIKIEEPLYDQEIPKMSLQPIVENAICHGIVENGEDAVIYIKAIRKGNDFEIAITDSGVGMSQEQLEKLERRIQGEIETSGGAGNGIGLKNVQDRIKMKYGDQYGLKFYSKEQCFTKVCVRLPLNPGRTT